MAALLHDVLETLRAHEGELRQFGVSHAAVFGSVARGDARPDSDVDLLVRVAAGNQSRLKLELESLLGRKVDIASDGWVKPSIRESVYRDAIAL